MASDLTRRGFLEAAGIAAAAGAVAADAVAAPASAEGAKAAAPGSIKILGISCSPRRGKSTAAALGVALEAARAVDPARIEVELIELAGLEINGDLAAGVEPEPGQRDDFPSLVPKLADPRVAGILIGTPVYFSNMTARCKAFLDRLIVFRKDFALRNKVAGVIAVGGSRNGGQLPTIESVQGALFGQDMIIVGAGSPTSRSGAAVWAQKDAPVTADETGMQAVRDLARRVAEVALRMAKA